MELTTAIGIADRPITLGRRHIAADAPVLAAVVAVSMLPILTPVGPANLTLADVAMAGTAIVAAVALATSGAVVRLPYAIAVGVITVAGGIAAVLGPLPIDGVIAMAQDVYLLLWCVALTNIARTAPALRTLLGAWVWSAAAWSFALLVIVAAGFSGSAGVSDEGSPRIGFTFGEANGAALYFAVCLLIIFAADVPRGRRARILVSGTVATALLLTGSLAGLTGAVVAIAVGTFLHTTATRGAARAIVAASVIGAVGTGSLLVLGSEAVLHRARYSSFTVVRDSLGREAASRSSRQLLDDEEWQLFLAGPIYGRGPVTTKYYLDLMQFPYVKEAHNDFLAALVERGVLGVTGLILLVCAVTARAVGIWHPRLLRRDFAAVVPRPAFLIGGLTAIGVFTVTHEALHERVVWTLLGLVAAVYAWGRTSTESGGEHR